MIMLEQIDDSPPADAAKSAQEDWSGYAIRFCPGPRANLRYQAGRIVHEHRNYMGPGMTSPFIEHVTLFWLLGHGETREEAVTMAQQRNGQ